MRARLIHYANRATPPFLWDAFIKLRGHRVRSGLKNFGAMQTRADTGPMHKGRFSELHDRYATLDPWLSVGVTRYRLYNVCTLARLCRDVPGDFVCAGVSFGVAPRMVYDYAMLPDIGKTLHLIDPFEGTGPGRRGTPDEGYNTDADYVRRQYPADAKMKMHRAYIPACLPLPEVERIAFVFCNTTDVESELESLPIFCERLSPDGIIVIDLYARYWERYARVAEECGLQTMWFPSGQGALFKK